MNNPAAAQAPEAAFMPVDQPLDLRATLESGQVFRWEGDGAWFWGVVGQRAYALRQEEGGLLFRTLGLPVEEARLELHRFLRLDDDLEAIYGRLARDRWLGQAVAQHPGLRLLRQDPWECLASFVCSSVSNIPRISRNLRSVAQALGGVTALDGQPFYRFPEATVLAEAGGAVLADLGLGFRAGYLARVARLVADGALDLRALRCAPYDEAKRMLVELPGVGEKVADCVSVFSLDKLEGFPIDRWVRRALVDWYGLPEKASYRQMLAWAQERWGDLAGYVQQYLFHHRRLMGSEGKTAGV